MFFCVAHASHCGSADSSSHAWRRGDHRICDFSGWRLTFVWHYATVPSSTIVALTHLTTCVHMHSVIEQLNMEHADPVSLEGKRSQHGQPHSGLTLDASPPLDPVATIHRNPHIRCAHGKSFVLDASCSKLCKLQATATLSFSLLYIEPNSELLNCLEVRYTNEVASEATSSRIAQAGDRIRA